MSPLILLGVLAQAAPVAATTADQAPEVVAPQPSPQPATMPADPSAGAPVRPQPAEYPMPLREPEQPRWRMRRFGVHLGINGTFLFDVSASSIWYFGAATQLTGLGFFFNTERNFNLSLQAFGGVALPIIEREDLRFTFDAAPAFTYTHAAPVNLLSIGVLAGVRVVHRSGFTFAVKLPLVGYAGAPDAQRGGLLMYYTNAIVTVPAITFGYSF